MTYDLNLVEHIAVSWLPHCFALHNHSTVAVCSLFIGSVHFNWTYFQFLCMLLRDSISNSGKAGLVIRPPTPACRHCAHSIGQIWAGHHLGFCKKSSSDLLWDEEYEKKKQLASGLQTKDPQGTKRRPFLFPVWKIWWMHDLLHSLFCHPTRFYRFWMLQDIVLQDSPWIKPRIKVRSCT